MPLNQSLPIQKGPNGEKIINCARHGDIVILHHARRTPISRIPPSGMVTRVPKRDLTCKDKDGAKYTFREYDKPQDLPPHKDGQLIVVTDEAYDDIMSYAAANRECTGDVYRTSDLIRLSDIVGNTGGANVKATGLILPPVLAESESDDALDLTIDSFLDVDDDAYDDEDDFFAEDLNCLIPDADTNPDADLISDDTTPL